MWMDIKESQDKRGRNQQQQRITIKNEGEMSKHRKQKRILKKF